MTELKKLSALILGNNKYLIAQCVHICIIVHATGGKNVNQIRTIYSHHALCICMDECTHPHHWDRVAQLVLLDGLLRRCSIMEESFLKISNLLSFNDEVLDRNKTIDLESDNHFEKMKQIGISLGRNEVVRDLLQLIKEKKLFINIGDNDGRNTTND